jgi:hypothetical protein
MPQIKSIEHFRVLPRWLFVKVTDENGDYGWGESTLEGHSEAVEGTLDALGKRFKGYEAEYGILLFGLTEKKPRMLTHLRYGKKVTLNTSGKPPGDWDSIVAAQYSCRLYQALTLRSGI